MATGSFNKVDNDKVIGGSARVLVAPKSYKFPASLAEIIDLITYAANATYGFIDVGTTKTTSNIAIQASTNEWRGEQQGPIRTLYQDYTGTATYEMEEMTQQNRALAGALIAADPVAGQHRTDWTARAVAPDQTRLCFLRLDPEGRIHASVAPLAQWDGSAIQRQFARGESESLPFPQKLYADPNTVSAVTGDPIIYTDYDSD